MRADLARFEDYGRGRVLTRTQFVQGVCVALDITC
jgi:hypothetical protein